MVSRADSISKQWVCSPYPKQVVVWFLRPSFVWLHWCSREKVLSSSSISSLWFKCSPSLICESVLSTLIPANQEPFLSFLSLDNPHCLGACQSHRILGLRPVWHVCVLQSSRRGVVRASKQGNGSFFVKRWNVYCWATARAAGKCMWGTMFRA